MKKMSYFVVFILTLFVFMSHTYASEILIVNENDVRFRSEANTNNSDNIIISFKKGTELTLIEKTGETGNGCTVEWYKALYGSFEGYICSKYVKEETRTEINLEDYETYEEYLAALGFLEDYIPKLVKIHEKYPNWKFRAMTTEIDFANLVSLEYDGYSKGWSLLWDSNRTLDGYKSLDSWSYNYFTDTFNQDFEGGGSNWYAPSKETIAYYLDTRNFLDEIYIFMFEKLSYNSLYHTKSGIEGMLKGTFMENKIADTTKNKTYADAFLDAAVKHGLSPYMLIARVIQEVGVDGSAIVSGTVPGYEGYYNFYNIGAYANTSLGTIKNGLEYAKKKGWTNSYKAIIGGAEFLNDGYISIGQDTQYLQKWDILYDSKIVNHQYMQNIEAPHSEASKMYNGYNKANLLNSDFTFVIPIYKNMPESTSLPDKRNPNNYLASLSVNGEYLFEKASDDTEFNLEFNLTVTDLVIDAKTVSKKAKIDGLGTINLTKEEEVFPIVVTAENGNVRTYNIKVTRSEEVVMKVSEIIKLLELKESNNNLSGFKVGTDIGVVIKNITDKENKASVSVFDKDGKEKTNGRVATGDKIKVKTINEEKEYSVVVYGDVSGDGKIDKVDAAAILRHHYKYTSYEGVFKIAADVSHDNVVDKVDAAAVLRDVYNYADIKQ